MFLFSNIIRSSLFILSPSFFLVGLGVRVFGFKSVLPRGALKDRFINATTNTTNQGGLNNEG